MILGLALLAIFATTALLLGSVQLALILAATVMAIVIDMYVA